MCTHKGAHFTCPLSDDGLLTQIRKLARLEQQVQATVFDNVREIETRRLH